MCNEWYKATSKRRERAKRGRRQSIIRGRVVTGSSRRYTGHQEWAIV